MTHLENYDGVGPEHPEGSETEHREKVVQLQDNINHLLQQGFTGKKPYMIAEKILELEREAKKLGYYQEVLQDLETLFDRLLEEKDPEEIAQIQEKIEQLAVNQHSEEEDLVNEIKRMFHKLKDEQAPEEEEEENPFTRYGEIEKSDLEEEISIEEAFDILDKEWSNIDGYGQLENNAVLHLSVGFSKALGGDPFGNDYAKLTFENIDRENGLISVIISNTTGEEEDIRKTFQIGDNVGEDDNFIKKLKREFGGHIFKMGTGLDSKEDFVDYVNRNEYIEGIEELDIPKEFLKYAKDGDLSDIAYIGVQSRKKESNNKGDEVEIDTSIFFKVAFSQNMVEISCTGGGFDKVMTYDEFLLFICDKNLYPFTAEKYQESRQKKRGENKSYNNVYSIANLLALIKMPSEELKSKWKRREDRLGTELYGNIIGSKLMKQTMGWVPYMNEISQEAGARQQHRIKSMIGDYKKYFDENFEHDTAATMEIRETILKDEATARRAHFKNRHRALGAYMYSASKDHIYFRDTSSLAGSGLWVMAILGPNYYQKYLQEFERFKKQAENKPGNKNVVNDVTQFEMNFIKDNIPESDLYPKSYAATLEGTRDVIWKNAQEGAEDMKNKSGFLEKRSSKFSFLKNHRLSRWIGAESETLESVRNYMEYKEMYLDNLFMSISGHINVRIPGKLKDDYQKHMRAIGFTPAYYNLDYGINGGKKVVELLDIITGKLMGTRRFSEAVGYDYEKINFGSNYHNANMQMLEKMHTYWQENGAEIIRILNLQNAGETKSLFNATTRKDLTKEEREAIDEYINKKSIDTTDKGEKFALDTLDYKNAYWQQNVMNYPMWVAGMLFKVDTKGKFVKGDRSGTLWTNVENTFSKLAMQNRTITSREKESIRKWGTEKVLQFLRGSGHLETDLETLVRAQTAPIGERQQYVDEIMRKKEEGILWHRIARDLDNNVEVKDLAMGEMIKSLLAKPKENPTKLISGVGVLVDFLESLR